MMQISEVFPWYYQLLFMILEPSVIFIALFFIPISPSNHFHSLAPSDSTGPFWSPSAIHKLCDAHSAWNTPQLRGLWYSYISALAFSGIIEPMVLYVARYKLRDIRDAEEVIKTVLVAFIAFDIFHASATLAVTGTAAALPGSQSHIYAMVNVWVPMAWMLLRILWIVGAGRKSAMTGMKRE
ncbi:uncharacterized protein FFB20_14114 [Fusarium fujikuroi]|uniref:EXPERA domain-containing protein n=1 Tax=Gibberella fujikuroi (strain CBS 195.34 / IMI 58289 / NRRL A-6831) TaxID=1279085 RepID=S0EHE5_GIBF5|nr:uncharacterized protein FFUJ_08083 [Fusarium fujikuroi IMI 58289]KLP09039.1 uncharacterized protein Y057_3315 [Fusarium fujikuroi]KLP10961.1 uncharacterized protein LW94_590 [Fusarium fujikuroi]CCT71808.1 uncharacterized protein FFUJ_08083 [Fusarium fujikuroi IMI 58289]SCO12628.1 uncharacterized protein FFE2_12647 [Fusarium fujikuroi]SCO12968.1 uncharacterized protein FFB20_14114 [Fusarium fujikuroi]